MGNLISSVFLKGADNAQQKKVKKVMKEFKDGKLKSSSGEKVTDKDQAVAIALSEAGLSKDEKDLDLQKAYDVLGVDDIEKAKDRSKLTQRIITDKRGHSKKVWVKPGEAKAGKKEKKKRTSKLMEEKGIKVGDTFIDRSDVKWKLTKYKKEKKRDRYTLKSGGVTQWLYGDNEFKKKFFSKKDKLPKKQISSKKRKNKNEQEVAEYFEDSNIELSDKFSIKEFQKENDLSSKEAVIFLVNLEDKDVMSDIARGDYDSFDIWNSNIFNDDYESIMEDLGYSEEDDY